MTDHDGATLSLKYNATIIKLNKLCTPRRQRRQLLYTAPQNDIIGSLECGTRGTFTTLTGCA